jgi:hypothetical protein
VFPSHDQGGLLEKYLELFPKIKKEKVCKDVMQVVEREHEKNTLGIRLINTLLNQYFINGGKLIEEETKKVSFHTTLDFN